MVQRINAFEPEMQQLADAGHELEEAAPAFADADTLARAMLVLVATEAAKTRLRFENLPGRKPGYQEVEPATWSLMVYGSRLRAVEALWAREVGLAQRRGAAPAGRCAEYSNGPWRMAARH